jgi:hypothetical protein
MRVEQVQERYTYHCRRCGALWTWEYSVRRFGSHSGTVQETFFRDGRPESPPWSVCCPYCSGLRIDIHPPQRGSAGTVGPSTWER